MLPLGLLVCSLLVFGCSRITQDELPANGTPFLSDHQVQGIVISKSIIKVDLNDQNPLDKKGISAQGDSDVAVVIEVPPEESMTVDNALQFDSKTRQLGGNLTVHIAYNNLADPSIEALAVRVRAGDQEGLTGEKVSQNITVSAKTALDDWKTLKKAPMLAKVWNAPFSGGISEDITVSLKADLALALHQKYKGSFVLELVKYISAPDDGLVGYYPFDGDYEDHSGNGHNLTQHGSPVLTADNTVSGSCLSLESGDYLSCDNFTAGQDDLTVSLWFKTANPVENIKLISAATWPPGSGWVLGTHYPELWADGGVDLRTSQPYGEREFIAGQWNHLVLTFKLGKDGQPSQVREYINGIATGYSNDNMVCQPIGSGDSIKLGQWLGGFWLNGQLDEVRIYNRALSEDEVRALYKLPWLKVEGRAVKDAYDQEVKLKGLGLTNGVYDYATITEAAQRGYLLSRADYQTIHDAGINSVRFYLQYKWLEDPQLFTYLDKQIEYARQNNIYVILNLHYFGTGGEGGFFPVNGAYTKAQVINFWNTISAHYKHESVIAGYDLINEPWVSEQLTEASLYEIYQDTLTSLRNLGDKHIVFLSDPVNKHDNIEVNWTQYFRGTEPFYELTDPLNNLCYEFHWYSPGQLTHQTTPWGDHELGHAYANGVVSAPGYPYVEQKFTYANGTEAYNLSSYPTDWTQVTSPWVRIAANTGATNVFSPVLMANNIGNGEVWFDDIILEKLKDGVITDIPLPNMDMEASRCWNYADGNTWGPSNDPANWYSSAPDGRWRADSVLTYDKSTNHTPGGSCSLKIGNNWSWANWKLLRDEYIIGLGNPRPALPTSFAIDPDAQYRIRCYIKTRNTTQGTVGIGFEYFQKGAVKTVDRTYLEQRLSGYYNSWCVAHSYPLYCGEWGVADPAQFLPGFPGSPDVQNSYIGDMAAILNDLGMHGCFHDFKDYKKVDNPANAYIGFGLYDPPANPAVREQLFTSWLN